MEHKHDEIVSSSVVYGGSCLQADTIYTYNIPHGLPTVHLIAVFAASYYISILVVAVDDTL